MKKQIYIPLAIIVFVFLTLVPWAISMGEEYFRARFMNTTKAEKRWGITPFNPQAFKAAGAEKRAAMAVDLVKRQIFVGKGIREVRQGNSAIQTVISSAIPFLPIRSKDIQFRRKLLGKWSLFQIEKTKRWLQ